MPGFRLIIYFVVAFAIAYVDTKRSYGTLVYSVSFSSLIRSKRSASSVKVSKLFFLLEEEITAHKHLMSISSVCLSSFIFKIGSNFAYSLAAALLSPLPLKKVAKRNKISCSEYKGFSISYLTIL